MDFGRSKKTTHLFPLHIKSEEVENIKNLKFLGIHITSGPLTLPEESSTEGFLSKKTQTGQTFLSASCKRFADVQCVSSATVYACQPVWYDGCTAENRKDTVYACHLHKKASNISKEPPRSQSVCPLAFREKLQSESGSLPTFPYPSLRSEDCKHYS